jgi:hypothetical protein
MKLMTEQPYLFQKCSMHTLMMINRCLSCIREDSNMLCESEMNAYMEKLRLHIAKQKELNNKLIKD